MFDWFAHRRSANGDNRGVLSRDSASWFVHTARGLVTAAALSLAVASPALGQAADDKRQAASGDAPKKQASASKATEQTDAPDPGFQLTENVREALTPLFRSVHDAKVSRATVEMLSDSLMNGRVVDQRKSVFQIASKVDDSGVGKFTVYLKEPDRRTRLYGDGQTLIAAMAPDAYVRLGEAPPLQQLVTDTPVILGPYPEPVLSLTTAGVDPAVSLVGGMSSLRIADKDAFESADEERIPAIHLEGIQADGVVWNLWVSDDGQPRPLRMLVDLTPMLIASRKMNVPAGYSQQVRYDFLSYRLDGDVSDSLFRYEPKPGATEFESVEAYYAGEEPEPAVHPLEGESAPMFRAADLNGNVLDTRRLRGRILVIDFWATWCEPCLEAMPMLQSVTKGYEKDELLWLSVNTGESREEVKAFYDKRRWIYPTLLDPAGKIADGYQADRIPQTVVVGVDGKVQSVLTGFSDDEDSAKRLRDAIEAARPSASSR